MLIYKEYTARPENYHGNFAHSRNGGHKYKYKHKYKCKYQCKHKYKYKAMLTCKEYAKA